MNRKSQEMSLQTIVVIVILLMLLILVITFVGGQLGDMFEGLGSVGSQTTDQLTDLDLFPTDEEPPAE